LDKDLNNKKGQFYIVGLICIVAALCVFFNKKNGKTHLSPDNLTELKNLKLSVDSKYNRTHGKSSTCWLEFKADTIQQIFQLSYPTYDCADIGLILAILKKDSVVNISISSKEFKKIGDIATEFVQVYNISKRQVHLVDQDCYNKSADDRILIIMSFCVGLGLFSFYLGTRKHKLIIDGVAVRPWYLLVPLVVSLLFSSEVTFW